MGLFQRRKSRKASLQLSINAIVIIVLAMTLLGLGLGFVRTQFKQIGDIGGGVQEQIKQQILEDLRTGDKKLSFPTSEITIQKREARVIAIGVKNTGNEKLYFGINVTAVNEDAVALGVGFSYDTREYIFELDPADANVYPIRLTAPTTAGTGIYEVMITGKTDTLTEGFVYGQKTFFITVTG